jgi:hypothetical protein
MGTPFPVEEPKAGNPPEGAILDYYFQSPPRGEVILEILDARNQLIRRYSTGDRVDTAPRRPGAVADVWLADPPRFTAAAGANRFAWDLRFAPPAMDETAANPFAAAPQGPQVMPGTYQVRLTAAGKTYTQPLIVTLDPRSNATPADLEKQSELSLACTRDMARAVEAMREMRTLRRQLADRKITSLDAEFAGLNFAAIWSQLNTALSVAQSADRTPPETAYTISGMATRDLTLRLAAWKDLQAKAAALLK